MGLSEAIELTANLLAHPLYILQEFDGRRFCGLTIGTGSQDFKWENHAMPHPPRLRVKLFGAHLSGEGVAGIIGVVVATCVILMLYPLVMSWVAASFLN